MLARLVEHPLTERFIITLIVINAITLGLETSPTAMAAYGPFLLTLDRVILSIFVAELVARIIVRRGAFFRDPWSLFDLFVVGIALVPTSEGLSVLRALRILRALRLITVVPSLRKVVAGLVGAMPGMGSIGLLLVLVYYVFAVMGTKLFGETNPELFGTIGTSAYTLFQDEVTAAEAPKITHPAHSDERIADELAGLRADIAALRREMMTRKA